jgi:hypothetical protein
MVIDRQNNRTISEVAGLGKQASPCAEIWLDAHARRLPKSPAAASQRCEILAWLAPGAKQTMAAA